ncbi:MAG: TadE/TadG family type IV pilus assembly protein [Alphaproteobacteria bacterium]
MILARILKTLRHPRRLSTGEGGNVAVETALVAPLLGLLMLGVVDVVLLVITANKLGRVTSQTADLVARQDSVKDSFGINDANELGVFFLAANEIAEPLSLQGAGRVIITSVADLDGTGPRIQWQRTGNYKLQAQSTLGAEGDLANMPKGFLVRRDENAIFAEVFYEYRPWTLVGGFLSKSNVFSTRVHRIAVLRPRIGSLATLN